MKKYYFFFFLIVHTNISFAQTNYNTDSSLTTIYQSSYDSLASQLITAGDFKKSVFVVENTYFQNKLNYTEFQNYISDLVSLCKAWQIDNPLKNYKYKDSSDFLNNFSIYTILKDTVSLIGIHGNKLYHLPYTYDFDDFFGHKNWTTMFISKLLITSKGNCHSFPYLYKILADELGSNCWLSLAPNHIYIKNRCKKIGWYNTELTSGDFPIDAWITTSGYIPVKAVQSGIYMDTLSNQQAIALCVLDLAKGYEKQTKNYYDGFIIKCCDLVLQYHPVNVQAMLLKAETLKRIYQKEQQDKLPKPTTTFNDMEQLYTKLFDLGYREMPEKMYMQWLRSVTEQRNKYGNKQLKETLKAK